MIAQILNRNFVLERMQRASANKDRVARGAPGDPGLAALLEESGLTAEGLRAALEEMERAAANESARPVDPIEGWAYIPRGEIVSLFQSALEEFYGGAGQPPL